MEITLQQKIIYKIKYNCCNVLKNIFVVYNSIYTGGPLQSYRLESVFFYFWKCDIKIKSLRLLECTFLGGSICSRARIFWWIFATTSPPVLHSDNRSVCQKTIFSLKPNNIFVNYRDNPDPFGFRQTRRKHYPSLTTKTTARATTVVVICEQTLSNNFWY